MNDAPQLLPAVERAACRNACFVLPGRDRLGFAEALLEPAEHGGVRGLGRGVSPAERADSRGHFEFVANRCVHKKLPSTVLMTRSSGFHATGTKWTSRLDTLTVRVLDVDGSVKRATIARDDVDDALAILAITSHDLQSLV